MEGLLYKAFRQNFASLLLALCVQMICSITLIVIAVMTGEGRPLMVESTVILLLVFIVLYITFADALFKSDEKHGWTNFVIASPLGHAGQIRSKYYFLFAEYLIVIFLNYISNVIVCSIQGVSDSTMYIMYMILFSIFLILTALEIPFLVYFGADTGQGVKSVVLIAAGMLVAIYALFGDIALLKEADIFQAIQDKIGVNTVLGIVSVLCALAVPIYYLSYRISCKLYRKGAENYEN